MLCLSHSKKKTAIIDIVTKCDAKGLGENLHQTHCRLQLHPTVRITPSLALLLVPLLDGPASSSHNHPLSLLIVITCNWPWCRHRVFNLALVPLQSPSPVLTGPDALSRCRRLPQRHGAASVAPERFANQWIFMQSSWRKSGGKPKYSFHSNMTQFQPRAGDMTVRQQGYWDGWQPKIHI